MDQLMNAAIVLGIIGLALLGAGLFTYFKSKTILSKWSVVQGKIISSDTSESGIRHNKRYSANILYEYTVDGKSFQSKVVDVTEMLKVNLGGRQSAENLAAKYIDNMVVQVYYDPSNPENSVLELNPNWILILQGVGVLVVAGVFTYLA
ncbi:MAG TPA: DUF3592 domain-containing protein [Anaerolineales bacterium]|nr:DUF3592 domain-containing protein [Anaerolineales bacterium]